jgi:phage-related protein
MTPQSDDMMKQVQTYRSKVTTYEELRQQIDDLLSLHGGVENMSPDEVAHYRELARQRDVTLSEMRWLEQQLLDEDDTI